MWQAICLQPGVRWFHLGGLLRCLWIGKELFFTNVSLGHLQLNGTYCLGHENQWTVRFDSRTKPPTSGQFMQNSRTLKPMYWTGNHAFPGVPLSLILTGEGQDFALSLPIDPAPNTAISPLRDSLISHNFSFWISSDFIELHREIVSAGIGLISWVVVTMVYYGERVIAHFKEILMTFYRSGFLFPYADITFGSILFATVIPDALLLSPSTIYFHTGQNFNLFSHAASHLPLQSFWFINGKPQELFIPNITLIILDPISPLSITLPLVSIGLQANGSLKCYHWALGWDLGLRNRHRI